MYKLRKISIILIFIGILTSCNKQGQTVTSTHYEINEPSSLRREEKESSLSESEPNDKPDLGNKLQTVEETETDKQILDTIQSKDAMITIYDIEDGYIQVPYHPNLEHHDYNWNSILEKNGYKYYQDSNHEYSNIGIDVSKYQGDIDWKQVKDSGIQFAIIRMGFRGYGTGKLVLDDYFIQNIEEALKAGIKVSVYFFSQAITVDEAKEEAEFVYEQIKEYDITYPVVFDTEEIKNDVARTDGLNVDELTQITVSFCERIKELGFKPMIYANAKWLTTKLDLRQLTEYEIWYADYQEKPLYPYQFKMWQYSEKGIVSGINGYVDLNIYFN